MTLELTQEQKDAGWQVKKLSECFDIIGGGTPKTSIGEYWGGEIPWLSVTDFSGSGRTVNEAEKSITQLGLDNSSAKVLERGDLIISARGTVGELAQLGRAMAFNQSCYGLRGASGVLTNNYGFYLMKTIVSALRQQSHGSVFSTITRGTFESIEVVIPPVIEQKRVAEILGSIDDKIEANSRLIDSLLELALIVFSSAKSRNETKVLDTLFKDFVGGDWGKEENDGSLFPVYEIRGADIPNLQKGGIGKLPLRYIKESSLKRRSLEPGDVVVEGSGGSPTQCTGRPALITQELIDNYDYPLVATNFCKIIKPVNQELGKSVYLGILDSWNSGELWQYETGTTGIKNLNFSLFASVKQIPDFDDSKYYLDLLAQIGQENSELMKIRGFLIRYLIG